MKSYLEYLIEKQLGELNDNFYKWFGNSKVVDDRGNPLVVYHGSNSKFDTFKRSKSIGNHGEIDQIKGIYFTDDIEGASWYSLTDDDRFLKSVYISIKNPYTVTDYKELKENLKFNYLSDVDNILINKGYDGLIIEKGFYSNGLHKLFLVFSPNQIKSIYNIGTWDMNDINIYK